MKIKLNQLLVGAIVSWGIAFADDSNPSNTVTISPSVKIENKTKAWRSLATQVTDNQKRVQAKEAKENANSPSFLSPLFKGIAYEAGATVIDREPEEKSGGFYGQIEHLNLTPYQSNNRFMVDADDQGGDYTFDLEGGGSQRYEIGYRSSPSSLGFRARFWHFDQDFSASQNPDDVGIIAWGYDEDDGAVTGVRDVDTLVKATQTFDVEVLDLEVTKSISRNSLLSFGIRQADFDQGYLADSDEGIVTSEMGFEGVGPTVAFTGEHSLTPSVSVYGGIRGSLLFGDQTLAVESPNNDLRLNNEGAMAGAVDTELGIRYTRGYFYAIAGMEAQYWMNVGTANPSVAISVGGEGLPYDPTDQDVGFIGWKLGAGFRF